MKNIKEENSNLRSKIRRLEEDNARKRKEIDALYDPSKVYRNSFDLSFFFVIQKD